VARMSKDRQFVYLLSVGVAGWLVPGAGHLILGERKRGLIILIAIVATFAVGLYVGSIGVINYETAKPWFVAQVMNSPAVWWLGYLTETNGYRVYGWPNEIGQIYTSTAGLLNLLCIVNAVYLAFLRSEPTAGG